MTDPNPPVTTKQAMPFESLLAQGRDLVCARLAEGLDGMLDEVGDTFSALINETQDPELRKLYLETKDKVLTQHKAIAENFRTHYLREFQSRSNRVKKAGQSFSELDASDLELNLVGEDDLNETLKLNDMATKLRQYCDEELVALDQRVGVLLGDANLEAEDNPFSPQAICDAFKLTCRQVDSNVKVRMVLLKLFDDHVLDDIRSVYKAVNTLLVQNSILPRIRFRVSRGQQGSKAPPGSTPHAADNAPSDGPDFFSVLQDLLAGNVKAMNQPGATVGTGAFAQGAAATPGSPPAPGTAGSMGVTGAPLAGAPMAGAPMAGAPMAGAPMAGAPMAGAPMAGTPVVVLQGAELMNLLTRVQHGDTNAVADGELPLAVSAGDPGTTNVLRELKASSVGTGMNQLDSMTLDIVALLFDQLFDDPKIPIAVKGLIGRMQIPMLKVAIADKAFFSKKSHPARQLLDTLGEISSRLPADFSTANPLFGPLEAIIQELMNNFQDDIGIFDVVRERLQIFVEEEDRRVEEETQLAAKRIEQNESLAASKTMAEYEVKTRVEAGNLPRPVKEFLMHQWVKPLLILHVRRGQHSDAWKNSLATMDLLIWSVEAKHNSEERQKLATLLPDLFKRLAAGLKIADVEDAIREHFFSDLRNLHAEAMSVGGAGEVAAAKEASPEDLSAKPDAALAMEFDSVPASTSDAAPVTAPDTATAIEFVYVPATESDAAAPTKPDVVPAAIPAAPQAEKADAVPVAKADVVPATGPVAAPTAKPVAVPVTSPSAAPAAKPDAVPATKPAAAPATRPDAVPATKPGAAPATRPGVTPTAKPAAAQAPRPEATPARKPVPDPTRTVQPIPATAIRAPASVEAQGADSDSLDFTKSLTIKNPFGAGRVRVQELESADVSAAGTPRVKGEVNEVEIIKNLKLGTWVEFREKGGKDTHQPAKLSYISPLRSSFLFVDKLGKTVKECSRTELGRLVRLRMVVVIDVVADEAPLFDRMMAGVIGKLS